jgi:hypothetical protein
LEHFNWELFDHPPYSPDLALCSYHLFIYPRKWLRSQCNNTEELMRSGCTHRQQTSLAQVYRNLYLNMTSVSIPAVTTLRSSLSMYVFFAYNNFFSLLVLVTAHQRLLSEQPSYNSYIVRRNTEGRFMTKRCPLGR